MQKQQEISYPNPPVVEAVLNISVKPHNGMTINNIQNCFAGERDSYPTINSTYRAQGTFKFTPNLTETSDKVNEQIGYVYRSADFTRYFQANVENFAVNYLKPYPGWPTLKTEARRLWQVYLGTQPHKITRLGLRYINKIAIPMKPIKLEDYIATRPVIAPGLPQGLNGFFFNLILPDTESASEATITITVEPPTSAKGPSLILDIDAYQSVSAAPNDESIWDKMDQLRLYKNKIFNYSLTDLAKEAFN